MIYYLIALGLLSVAVFAWFYSRRSRREAVALASTYDGPIAQYDGGKTLLVAIHARWASVWRATAAALSGLDPALYDLKLIDADRDQQAVRDLGVAIIPTVLVFRDGREVARCPNLMSLDQLP